jgi:hypothetical protein
MLPANSKIGKYIITTMPPITNPIKPINNGSNNLENIYDFYVKFLNLSYGLDCFNPKYDL